MGKIVETLIDRFDGGMTNLIRRKEERFSRILNHFNISTDGMRLIPNLSMEADGSAGDTEKLVRFLSVNAKHYGLGVVSGTTKAKIFERASLPAGAWGASTTGEDSNTGRKETLFIAYENQTKIYGARANTIWSYQYATNTYETSERSLTHAAIEQGLVHSKDDILYIPYDNKIAKNNAGTWTDAALTLPTNYVISSICEYGNYIAIACKAVNSNNIGNNSVVYLWDRDTSLTTLSESIDWGVGELLILEELEGNLIGVTSQASISAFTHPKIIFKYWNGGTMAKQFLEIIASTTAVAGHILGKQRMNKRIAFMMDLTINSVRYDGVWSIGKNELGEFSLSLDYLINNDTAIASPIMKGFHILGDYLTAAFLDNSVYVINRSNDDSDYATATSVYESLIKNLGDSDKTKKLLGATLLFEPLPAAGVVRLFYKKDEETAFTRIFTFGTDDKISHGANQIEIGSDTVTMTIASPAVVTLTNHDLVAGQAIRFRTTGALPTGVTAGTIYYVISAGLAANTFRFSATSGGSAVNTSGSQSGTHTLERDANLTEFKEIQFKIESSGNAVITGLKFKAEFIDKEFY